MAITWQLNSMLFLYSENEIVSFDAFKPTFNSNLVKWTTPPNKNKIDKTSFCFRW